MVHTRLLNHLRAPLQLQKLSPYNTMSLARRQTPLPQNEDNSPQATTRISYRTHEKALYTYPRDLQMTFSARRIKGKRLCGLLIVNYSSNKSSCPELAIVQQGGLEKVDAPAVTHRRKHKRDSYLTYDKHDKINCQAVLVYDFAPDCSLKLPWQDWDTNDGIRQDYMAYDTTLRLFVGSHYTGRADSALGCWSITSA